MTVRTIDEIFRDFVTDGVPASGPFNPHKPDIRDTLKALTEGGNNFPDNRVIRLNNADEGTANNIVVTASVAIPAAAYQVLYILNVTQENTGPVTVSGAINRDLVTNINQPIAPGYIIPGMALLCVDTGTVLRLLSYGADEAILAAAEAAADRAEEAAEAAEAAAGGLLSSFASRSEVQITNIPSLVTFLRTAGYFAAGDGGGTLYKRVVNEPTHAGKIQSADGAWWEITSWQVNVRMFGAVGNGAADDTQAFKDARDFFQTPSAHRGGRLYISKGVYLIKSSIDFTYYEPEQVHNIILFGDGPQATVLDFSQAVSGSDGITFGKGVHFSIEDLSVNYAKRDGIRLIGGALGTDDYSQQIRLKNVRVSFSGRHNIYSENIFMARFEDVWAPHAGDCGFVFAGFHTSIIAERSWANGCGNTGWTINGAVYSAFHACGSDDNLYGYAVSNVAGCVFNACGAESNKRDSWLFSTSDASAQGVLYAGQDIHGAVLIGCFGYRASLETPGQFANLLSAKTADNRPMQITLIGCKTEKAASGDPSVVANGLSGRIRISEENCSFDGSVAQFNNVLYEGRRFTFTPSVAGTATAGTATYSKRSGSYSIVKGVLSYSIEVQWSGHTGAGGTTITGLPVAPVVPSIGPLQTQSLVFTGAPTGLIDSSSTTIFCTEAVSGGSPGYIALPAAGKVISAGNYFVL